VHVKTVLNYYFLPERNKSLSLSNVLDYNSNQYFIDIQGRNSYRSHINKQDLIKSKKEE
jgi:hypothetical protein